MQTKLTSQESEHAKFKRLIAKLRIERNDMHNQLVECQGVIHKLAKLGNVGAEQLQKVMVNVKGRLNLCFAWGTRFRNLSMCVELETWFRNWRPTLPQRKHRPSS